jgi:hypothetical protein
MENLPQGITFDRQVLRGKPVNGIITLFAGEKPEFISW